MTDPRTRPVPGRITDAPSVTDEARRSPEVRTKEAQLLKALGEVSQMAHKDGSLRFRIAPDVMAEVIIYGETTPGRLRRVAHLLEANAAMLEDSE